jgi:hypothetical protein
MLPASISVRSGHYPDETRRHSTPLSRRIQNCSIRDRRQLNTRKQEGDQGIFGEAPHRGQRQAVMDAGKGFRESEVACVSTGRIGRCKERLEVVLCCQVWN